MALQAAMEKGPIRPGGVGRRRSVQAGQRQPGQTAGVGQRNSALLKHGRQAQLAVGLGRGRGAARGQHRQPWRPGGPVMAPEIAHQFGMNRQLAQLAEAQGHPLGRDAMAATAAAGAVTHGAGVQARDRAAQPRQIETR